MIRAFVGVRLPESLTARLAAVQAGLPVGRPVDPEDMHLTLAFLGEQPEPVLEDLHHLLAEIAARPFEIAIDGLGMFGTPPRTLHAQVVRNEALNRLAGGVQRAAMAAGVEFKPERFRPHVTIARFAKNRTAAETAALRAFVAERVALRLAPVPVAAMALYRSHLRKDGAVYDILAEYPLG